MIYPKFLGRLGNNMFQAAACIGYAKKHNVKWGIKKGYIERGFNAFQIDKFFPNLPSCELTFNRYNEHKNEHCELHNVHKDMCHFDYHPIPFHPHGVEIVGFWQSYKYFENAEEEVKAAFKLNIQSGYEDYSSIHVRLGDYIQHANIFPPVTADYVRLAMQKTDKRKFMVFSDDIPMCTRILLTDFPDATFEFSEGRNEFEDMSLMASCGDNIIANSSFSWWSAWLNPNPNKVVISPSHKRGQWFGMESGIKQDCVDLLPPAWHQIEFR